MQLRDVLFHIRMVWSSEHEILGKYEMKVLERGETVRETVTHNPRHLVMEHDRSHIVQMSMEGEQATSTLGADICSDIIASSNTKV